ncbi:type II toxin-antitoxin system HicB family antitoxin [Nostoc sp.]|uniref:type II toxin-antitoxin system HicB family antitoxin n=1 Tax=Nostoc sp. TaxID=1180 RepID=UPI002FF4BFF3
MRYTVVIEKGETSYGAYVPDLPGCVAVGETLEEVKQMITEAIEFHLEGMLEDGLPELMGLKPRRSTTAFVVLMIEETP